MSNKTLLIFLGLEGVFVATGIALLVVGIIFEPKPAGQSGPLDPGTNLLLSTIPLTGTIPRRLSFPKAENYSCHRQCGPDLCDLPRCRPRHPALKGPQDLEIPLLARHRLRHLKSGHWSDHLVFHTANTNNSRS